eukprot:513351_1
MTSSIPPSKKRKLDLDTEQLGDDYKEQCVMDTILSTPIDAIFGNRTTDTNQLEEFAKKLELIQDATKIQIMNSLNSFDTMDSDEIRETLEKFIICISAKVDSEESESYNAGYYRNVSSQGQFAIGPNKQSLEFSCDLYGEGSMISGSVTFGQIWKSELDDGHPSTEVNLDEVKKLVEKSGIKGIGNKSRENTNIKQDCYGYDKFANDLIEICLDLVSENSDEGCWYGDIPEVDLGLPTV